MRTVRFFCQSLLGDSAILDAAQSRHLRKVLRLKVGDCVQVFDGNGRVADAQIERIERDAVGVRLLERTHIPPKTSGRIILAVSMAKGERFDWMIEKCTELGTDHIAAVQYARTVKMGKQSALDRYHKIALAATKQCGRAYVPVLSGPDTFESTLHALKARYPEAVLHYGDAAGQGLEPLGVSDARPDRIVCIGPEGGFSDAELRIFADFNAQPTCVNPHILRIETAAVAFATLLCQNSQPIASPC